MPRVNSIISLAKNARSLPRLSEVFRKAWIRIREPLDRAQIQSRLELYEAEASDFDAWARAVDPKIHGEMEAFWAEQQSRVATVLPNIGIDLGGGGHVKLLYFLVRIIRPETVVETGVAAGHSSRAILSALERNAAGELYSSDLPYLLVDNSDAYVGVLVEQELRNRWHLYTEGDRANLPQISESVQTINLFHYDSDKTAAGREFARSVLRKRFTASTIIIFDDIQDNDHFESLAHDSADQAYKVVFQFGSKSVGMLLPRSLELGSKD